MDYKRIYVLRVQDNMTSHVNRRYKDYTQAGGVLKPIDSSVDCFPPTHPSHEELLPECHSVCICTCSFTAIEPEMALLQATKLFFVSLLLFVERQNK